MNPESDAFCTLKPQITGNPQKTQKNKNLLKTKIIINSEIQ